MDELIEKLTKNYENAPPFIKSNPDKTYSLVGNSDLASGEFQDYGPFGLGKHKLTALNHSKTLLALMNYILLLDAIVDNEELDVNEEETKAYLEFQFADVMSKFFGAFADFTYELAFSFIDKNKNLVNEALYNITKDKETIRPPTYQEQVYSLEGYQFQDPYVSIAYDIAKEFRLRPYEVASQWTTPELIVVFAKISNERSLESFVSWNSGQKNAPKPEKPVKQRFYFEEIGGEENV